jgi:VWFA-related protein
MRFQRVSGTLLVVSILLAAGWIMRHAIVMPSVIRAQQSADLPPAQATVTAPEARPNVLRAESRVVRVDAIVTDKKGDYVTDLTAKDFHVYDNNKEQDIVNFSFGSGSGSSAAPDRHYMVLFFDDSTMTMPDQPRARDAALKFIDANVGPGRVMAVVDFTGSLRVVQNFTADAVVLKKAAAYYRASAVSPNNEATAGEIGAASPALFQAEDDFGVHTFLLAIRSLAKNLMGVPGRKSLVLFTDGFPLSQEEQAELTSVISECNQANVAIYPIDVRGLIAPMPGPSANRFNLNRNPAWPALVGSNRTSSSGPHLLLAAYPVPAAEPQHGGGGTGGGGGHGGGGGAPGGGTGGGRGGPAGGSPGPGSGGRGGAPGAGGAPANPYYSPYGTSPYGPVTPQMLIPTLPDTGAENQSVLYELADGTGGFPIYNTNDLLGGLVKIAHEQDEYYLLGYVPPEGPDGSCHALKVKVDRGGLKVRSRTGYCSTKPKDMLVGKPIEKDLEAHAAAPSAAGGGFGGSIEAPFFYTSPNEARVNVSMDVPSSSVQFSKEKGKYVADVNVLGIASAPDGSVAARFSDEVKLEMEKDVWKKFLESPMRYHNQFEIAPGTYNLTVVLSTGGQSFGRYQTPLQVDPYDGKGFSVSSIALSDNIEPAEGLGGALEADLLSDRTPLVVQNMEVIPAGSYRFKRTETVALYAQLYDPHLADPTPPSIDLDYNIVDLKTGKPVLGGRNINTAPFLEKGSSMLPVGLKVPIDQLNPGSYRIDLQASDAAGHKTLIRSVAFEAD